MCIDIETDGMAYKMAKASNLVSDRTDIYVDSYFL